MSKRDYIRHLSTRKHKRNAMICYICENKFKTRESYDKHIDQCAEFNNQSAIDMTDDSSFDQNVKEPDQQEKVIYDYLKESNQRCQLTEKELIDFYTKENNKNRRMHYLTRNPHLDFNVYGTAAMQFIETGSLKSVIKNNVLMHDVLNENMSRQELVNGVVDVINEVVDDHVTVAPVMTESSDIKSQYVVKVDDMAKAIPSQIHKKLIDNKLIVNNKSIWDGKVLSKMNMINKVANSSSMDMMMMPNHSDFLLKTQESECAKKDKLDYVKHKNNLRMIDGHVMIDCYCCKISLPLKSSAIHRGHNLPSSQRGCWALSNIFLICANCNQEMSHSTTIEEYICSKINIEHQDIIATYTKVGQPEI